MKKLHVAIERSGDGSTIRHPEVVQHIQEIMSLSQQYGIEGMDHFDHEEVVKVPQVLHLKCNRQLGLDLDDFSKVGLVTTKSSTYNNTHTRPFGPFWKNTKESDFKN